MTVDRNEIHRSADALLYLLRTAYHAWFTLPSVEAILSPKGGCTEAIVR